MHRKIFATPAARWTFFGFWVFKSPIGWYIYFVSFCFLFRFSFFFWIRVIHKYIDTKRTCKLLLCRNTKRSNHKKISSTNSSEIFQLCLQDRIDLENKMEIFFSYHFETYTYLSTNKHTHRMYAAVNTHSYDT